MVRLVTRRTSAVGQKTSGLERGSCGGAGLALPVLVVDRVGVEAVVVVQVEEQAAELAVAVAGCMVVRTTPSTKPSCGCWLEEKLHCLGTTRL